MPLINHGVTISLRAWLILNGSSINECKFTVRSGAIK